MKIIGYSERGAMNALFYGMAFDKENGEKALQCFLSLANIDFNLYSNYILFMEYSLSDFGSPDLVIIAENKENKDDMTVFFVEAKASECSKFSLSDVLSKHNEDIRQVSYVKGEASNLFFQLKLKKRLFDIKEDLPTCEKEYKANETDDRDKIRVTKNNGCYKKRSIGNNPVVRRFIDIIKKCASAYYIAIIPESKELKKGINVGVDIKYVTWEEIIKRPILKKYVASTIDFNQGIDPKIKSKRIKSQILNNPLPMMKRLIQTPISQKK